MKRKSGVLMHISSLFGNYSCGSLGENARYFIDFLKKCGFSYWQILPINDTDDFNSPYTSNSAFSCNPFFLDIEILYEKGLIFSDELINSKQNYQFLCEFDRLKKERFDLLKKAALRTEDFSPIENYLECKKQISNYCEFMAKKSAKTNREFEENLKVYKFIQYEFYSQFKTIKQYANKLGIEIIGDMPFYISKNSSDVFYHKSLFLLDDNLKPTKVAAVPPDYFSKNGQLWGNPLYNWQQMKKDNYKWWCERISFLSDFFDILRIDHFRAIESYYAVDNDKKDARQGEWLKGPGFEFIDILKNECSNIKIIAEDLGEITDKVRNLLIKTKIPGMRVFQFGFDNDNSPHLPHNYPENCISYTGTHDNNTLLGFLYECDENKRQKILEYCNHNDDFKRANFSIIKTMLKSSASTVIFPIQDILGFGKDTRMNTPGKAEGNWAFRITKEQLDSIDTDYLKHINMLYGRC